MLKQLLHNLKFIHTNFKNSGLPSLHLGSTSKKVKSSGSSLASLRPKIYRLCLQNKNKTNKTKQTKNNLLPQTKTFTLPDLISLLSGNASTTKTGGLPIVPGSHGYAVRAYPNKSHIINNLCRLFTKIICIDTMYIHINLDQYLLMKNNIFLQG